MSDLEEQVGLLHVEVLMEAGEWCKRVMKEGRKEEIEVLPAVLSVFLEHTK